MMKMSFYFGYEMEDILFKNVDVYSIGGFVGLVVVVVLLTLGLEGLKVARGHLDRVRMRPCAMASGPRTSLVAPTGPQRRTGSLVAATMLHTLSVLLGYLMMLIVMLYNAYVFIAFILAVGLGYFLFGGLEANLKAGGSPCLAREMTCGLDNPAMVAEDSPGPQDGPSTSGESGAVVVEVHA